MTCWRAAKEDYVTVNPWEITLPISTCTESVYAKGTKHKVSQVACNKLIIDDYITSRRFSEMTMPLSIDELKLVY